MMLTKSHMMVKTNRTAVSLFCSGGVADVALRAAGFEIVVASELREDRALIYKANFPQTEIVIGDVRACGSSIIDAVRRRLHGRELDLLLATPPCQGMSKNGRGKLLSAIRAGLRPEFDPRNQLIIDTIDLIAALRPRHVLLENVPEMRAALIEDRNGTPIALMDFIKRDMPPDYVGADQVIEFADYGVPQRRQRLITIFTRDPGFGSSIASDGSRAFPKPTHSKNETLLSQSWVCVDETIGNLPPLDARSRKTATSDIPFHRVPILDEDKYFWVSHTPPGKSAFDNQCANPSCGFAQNAGHGASHDSEGINRAHTTTPIRCVRCDAVLPRPWVREGDEFRLMKGYTSAYKRMRGDLPASALTRNLSFACSDQKLHPTQNRVLSLKEAFLLHTIDRFSWKWMRADGRKVTDSLIREIVGESVPPWGLLPFFSHIANSSEQANEHWPLQSAIG